MSSETTRRSFCSSSRSVIRALKSKETSLAISNAAMNSSLSASNLCKAVCKSPVFPHQSAVAWCKFVTLEFVTTTLNVAAVFVGGMSDLRAIPVPTVATFYSARKQMNTAVSSTDLITPRQFTWDHIEYLRGNNCRVVIFHIVLWDFACVNLFLLGEDINIVAFLKERIASVP